MSPDRSGLLGTFIVVTSACLFATLGVLSRLAYDEGVTPFAFVTWRASVGALGLWTAIVLLRARGVGVRRAGDSDRGGSGPAIPRAAIRGLVVAILLGAALNLSMFVAFERTTVALALLGFYTYPALVAGASALLGRERLDLARTSALALSIGGMVAVVLGGADGSDLSGDVLGIAAALGAAIFQTAFVLQSRSYTAIPAERAMGSILAGTGLIAAIVTLATAGPTALAVPLESPQLLGLHLFVGLFAAALPSFLFLTGIRRIGAVRTGILMLAEPVGAVALAAIVLAEGVTLVQAIGGATILLSGILVQRDSRPTDAVPAAVAPAPGGP
jgi:drug/metabolite transporter (DMT)-like permease